MLECGRSITQAKGYPPISICAKWVGEGGLLQQFQFENSLNIHPGSNRRGGQKTFREAGPRRVEGSDPSLLPHLVFYNQYIPSNL